MLLLATGLLILGGITALFGQRLFRLLLPIVGLVVGVMVGFGGVQGVFGTGVISLTIAILMAIIVGLIMVLLSFVFVDIAIRILLVLVGVSLFSYLGVAIGLQDNGFVLFLMAIAGGVFGLVMASGPFISLRFVMALTAFVGVSLILGGIFIFAGDITLDQLNEQGIIASSLETINQSFLWFFVWLAGSVVALNMQASIAARDVFPDTFEYEEVK